jgi:hypothetical protein
VYLGNHDEYLKSIFDEFLQHKQFFPEVLTPHFHKENNIITSEFNFEDKKIRANIFGQENLEYIALACQLASDM